MTTRRFTGLSFATFIFLAGILTGRTAATDSLKVTISIFSGRPDPVYTLSDSGSANLLKQRLNHYLLRSDPGDSGAPLPLSTMGYRGVELDEFSTGSIYRCLLSNGSATFTFPASDHRFFDRGSELQKMVLRLLKRELTLHPQTDSEVLTLLPDSLTADRADYGIITIELNSQFSSSGCAIDASRLGMGNKYLSKSQDSIVVTDFTIGAAGSNGFTITSWFGVAEVPQTLPGLPAVGFIQPEPSSTLHESYRNVLLLAAIKPATLSYQQQITCTDISTTGKLFVVRTSEGGYTAIVTAGCYVGGYDRLHLFRYFTTANEFSVPATTGSIRRTVLPAGTVRPAPARQLTRVILTGQKIDGSVRLRNRAVPGERIVVW